MSELIKVVKIAKLSALHNSRGDEIPWLRLQGQYLMRHGFNPHDVVKVEITPGQILITKMERTQS